MWASGWLAFRLKAANVFLGLDFNFQVLAKGEGEEFDSDDEAEPVVVSDTPSSILGEPKTEVPVKAGSPTSVVGTSPFDLHGLEIRVTKATRSPASDI